MKLLTTLFIIFVTSLSLALGLIFLPEKQEFTVSGQVQAKEIKNASPFGGRIKAVFVHEGDQVKVGQELLQFDDIDLRTRVAAARAALKQAQAQEGLVAQGADVSDIRQAQAQLQQAQQNLSIMTSGGKDGDVAAAQTAMMDAEGKYSQAKAAYDSASEMLSTGIISQQRYTEINSRYAASKSAYDASKSRYKLMKNTSPQQISIARAQVSAARAQYDRLRGGANSKEMDIAVAGIEQARSAVEGLEAQLLEATLKAPIAGVITVLNATPGELVQPGRPVIAIIDENNLWADVYVKESQLRIVRVGQQVTVTAPKAYDDAVFTGKILSINPKSEFVPGSNGNAATEESSFRVKVHVNKKDVSRKNTLRSGMKVDIVFQEQ